ncbi:hypothetical protein [Phycisphaera mikurensis]|uniref:Uncharacterized protein n=1 Tax=Phycisphaera mikurensis (strain NBRC 102666 / KCTC 22515 / FYK2301M01) TaxID=1142394 RepID=I0IH71_PHYMF|nr:hypothetical protein [Phycisphaera mikurensis]MBB6440860.1 hypothetical protein [Phycisphaera mikurensis]BAM04609.1 hypothetical protein PSMK_24500 [Phycisphaera mikurensis NBRC 102666]
MRRASPGPVLLLIALGTLAAPARPQQAVEAAEPADAAAAGVTLSVRPVHVQLQRSLGFDEEGEVRQRDAGLAIRLVADVETGLEVLSVAPPEVASLTCSFGLAIPLPPGARPRQGPQPLQRRHGDAGPGSVSIQLQLPHPPAADGIREASGTLTLTVADGPRRELRFVPLDRFLGRTVVVEDLGGAEVKPTRDRNGRVRFDVPAALARKVGGVGYARPGEAAAFDPEPARFSPQGGDQATVWLQDQRVPEGGGVVFRVYPDAREIVLPWRCGPFALPTAQPPAGLRLALRTVAEGAAPEGEAGPGAAEAADRPLPLRIDGEPQPPLE